MKAFIFNSGTGSRMGDLTISTPKALVKFSNGESILSRQLRLLKLVGIRDVVITTGPFDDQIRNLCSQFTALNIQFVNNPLYQTTNSIYSLFLAKSLINEDFIVLHGDLVFDQNIMKELINFPSVNACVINSAIKLPSKDFKGRIINGYLKEISVNIFDDNCFALQPLYKISKNTFLEWIKEIKKFILQKNSNVYAENALNNILYNQYFKFLNYKDYFIEEIDNKEDLFKVNHQISSFDYKNQNILWSNDFYSSVNDYLKEQGLKKPFIIHGKHFNDNSQFKFFSKQINGIQFSNFSPNPTYEEVLEGLKNFKNNNCDSIIALSGGSGIDLAKAIKLFSPYDKNYLHQIYSYVNIPLVAIPTTAGTGSESTRYSVIYFDGEKQSLTHDCLLPNLAILSPNFLIDLPDYHKKSSLLDAFCQALESFWSINSNETSKKYASDSLVLFLKYYRDYLNNVKSANYPIMQASNLSGKAINISQTTAPHALSYKLTKLTGIAHGHSVSLLLPLLMEYMLDNLDSLQDPRGEKYYLDTLQDLSKIFSQSNLKELILTVKSIIDTFNLPKVKIKYEMLNELSNSVNLTRLRNNPIYIDYIAVRKIYSNFL